MRKLFPLAAAFALTAASVLTAHAHAAFEVRTGMLDSYKAVMLIAHGSHALKSPAPLLEFVAGDDAHAGHHMSAMGGNTPTGGEPVTLGSLKISEAWTKAMLPGQPVGGGFLTIENTGTEADRLVSASTDLTPDLQIHEMKMEGDVMKMRQLVDGLEIPAGGKVELKPGGYHFMFMQLKAPFKPGDGVKIKLKFEKAGEVDITLPVGAADAKGAMQMPKG